MKVKVRDRDGYRDAGYIYLDGNRVILEVDSPLRKFFEQGFRVYDKKEKKMVARVPEHGIAFLKAAVLSLQRSSTTLLSLEDRDDLWFKGRASEDKTEGN